MATVSLETEGFDRAIRKLETFPNRVAKRAVLKGLRRPANEFKKAAKARAPVRRGGGPKRIGSRSTRTRAPGFLRRKGIITRKQRGRPAYRVGLSGVAFYGAIYETGAFRTGRQPARPWFLPSWRRERQRVVGLIGREMRDAVRFEARKLRG